MKARIIPFLLALFLFAGCTAAGHSYDPPAPADSAAPAANDADPLAQSDGEADDDVIICDPPASQPCRIIDGAETGTLLLASLPGGIYGDGVFRLTVTDDIEIWMDGEQVTAADLEDGMPIDVAYDGAIQETFPGSFTGVRYLHAFSRGTRENPGGTYYDLCGLYLQVLDDLWQVDPALNTNISTAIVDLSAAPGMDTLNAQEQAALLWRFGELHDVTALDVNDPHARELLDEAGYNSSDRDIRDRGLTDACLFTIRAHETDELEVYSLPVLRFDALKWAAPLASYCFYDCSTVWAEFGTWSGYQVGAEMIS